jgi:hypothetical protein
MKFRFSVFVAALSMTGFAHAVTGDLTSGWNLKKIKNVWYQTWPDHYLVEIETTDGGDYFFKFDPNSLTSIQLANNYHAAALSSIATGNQVKLFLIDNVNLGGITTLSP